MHFSPIGLCGRTMSADEVMPQLRATWSRSSQEMKLRGWSVDTVPEDHRSPLPSFSIAEIAAGRSDVDCTARRLVREDRPARASHRNEIRNARRNQQYQQ
jgi:hypothetical protein